MNKLLKSLKKILFLNFIFLITIPFFVNGVEACNCIGPEQLYKNMVDKDIILKISVKKITQDKELDNIQSAKVYTQSEKIQFELLEALSYSDNVTIDNSFTNSYKIIEEVNNPIDFSTEYCNCAGSLSSFFNTNKSFDSGKQYVVFLKKDTRDSSLYLTGRIELNKDNTTTEKFYNIEEGADYSQLKTLFEHPSKTQLKINYKDDSSLYSRTEFIIGSLISLSVIGLVLFIIFRRKVL